MTEPAAHQRDAAYGAGKESSSYSKTITVLDYL